MIAVKVTVTAESGGTKELAVEVDAANWQRALDLLFETTRDHVERLARFRVIEGGSVQ